MTLNVPEIARWIQRNSLRGGGTAVSADTRLLEEGWLDSMLIVQLVSFIETALGKAIPIDEVSPENFETPARIAALADRLGAGDKKEP